MTAPSCVLVVSTCGASEVTSTISCDLADLQDRVESHHLIDFHVHSFRILS